MDNFIESRPAAWLMAVAIGAALAGCGGGAGGSGAGSAPFGSVYVSVANPTILANTGTSLQVLANASTDQALIQSMSWTTQSADPAAPPLVVSNADCATATRSNVTYASTGLRATGTSNWTCALSVAAPAKLVTTTKYKLYVTVKDDKGNANSSSADLTYTVAPAGNSSVPGAGSNGLLANAGVGFSILPGGQGNLHCSATSGLPSSTGYTYQWVVTGNGGSNVVLSSYNTADTTFKAPAVSASTDLTFQCVASDSAGVSSSSTVTVTDVGAGGSTGQTGAPGADGILANAGLDFSLLPGATGNLHCSASGGVPGSTGYTYQWLVTANGGANLFLSSYNSADVTFTAPPVSASAQLGFKCVASDGAGSSSSSVVSVTDTGSPAATSSLVASAGKGLNVNPGQTVALDASATGWFSSTGQATAGPAISYQWTSNFAGLVINNPNAASTTFVAPTSITSATPVAFTLTATAGGTTSSSTVNYLVDPFAPFSLSVNPSAQVVDVASNGIASLTAIGNTTNGTPTLYYNWTFVSGPDTPALGGKTTANLGFVPKVAGSYVYQVAVGYQPITASYPGVYFAQGTVTAK